MLEELIEKCEVIAAMAVKKILIVDDDREFAEELKELLFLSGYEAVVINDSKEAFDAAFTLKPDIILLDIKMDGMDGFQVLEKLKQFPETARIPVIAMTGYFTKEEHVRLISVCGMDVCLKKPFNALDLIARIEFPQRVR
jgi:CheY-like chemotaxis protein